MTVEKQTKLILQIFPFLEKEDINALLDISSYKEYKNKEIIVQEGICSPFTFFIITGAIRGYFIDQEGIEKNMFIKSPPNFIGPPDSLFENVPTKYFFEAVQKNMCF